MSDQRPEPRRFRGAARVNGRRHEGHQVYLGEDLELPAAVKRLAGCDGLKASLAAKADHDVVQARCQFPWEEQKTLLGEVAQIERLATGQRVRLGEECDHGLAADRLVGELAGDLWTQRDRHVNRTGTQRREHPCVPHLFDQQRYVGMT